MSFIKKSLVIAGGLMLLSFNSLAAQATKTLTYKNQRGSIMEFTVSEEGQQAGSIKGTFTTAVGNCQIEVGKPMALSGFYSGNAVSVSVNYPQCKKTIAMTGHFSDDRRELHTLWLVAEDSQDPRGKNWNSNIVGSDYYRLQG